MTVSVTAQPPVRRIGGGPARSVAAASRIALGALLLRDLVVLRKHLWEFVLRTLVQPFLLCFVFLYVFPKIGQGIGGHGPVQESAFATILVPGVVGISVMFQGVQSIALAMAQEFGFTREIEDRVQAPCRSGWWRWPRCCPARPRACCRRSSCCPSPRSCTPPACTPTSRCTGC